MHRTTIDSGRPESSMQGLSWWKKTLGRVAGSIFPADLRLFARAICSGPQAVGAACPSSRRLADYMASQAVAASKGYIVELGAGTGVVTASLLDHGVAPERLIVVEKSALWPPTSKSASPTCRPGG